MPHGHTAFTSARRAARVRWDDRLVDGRAVRLAAGRAFPGPVTLALWIAVTVSAPLLVYEVTHRWEESQKVWTAATLPVLAATVSARWTRTGPRRGVRPFLSAVAVGTAVSALFLVGWWP